MAGLLTHARESPDRLAYVLGDTGFAESYGELEERSRRLAAWLRGLGLRDGDSIAMLIGNSPVLFDVYWATQRIGLYLTPLNWHARPDELAFILDNSDARVLIAEGTLAGLAAAVADLAGDRLEHRIAVGGPIPGFVPLNDAIAASPVDAPLQNERAGSVMIYSSGTTGQPKGVRRPLSGRAFDDPAYVDATTLVMRTFGFTADDTYLCPAPLYHAGPLRSCTAMQMLGATVIAMQRFEPEAALRVIAERQVSVAQFVPTHFKRMLDLPEAVRAAYDHRSLRIAVHAAAPCPPAVKRAMIGWWGPILLEYYAGTEGGGTLIGSAEWLERPGSVGRPWAGLDLAILDAAGAMVKTPRLEGPIYFRNLPGWLGNFAYHKDPERTRSAYRGEWFTLGDVGYLDDAGYLFLTDRQSNLIISGGVNISPQEAEDALAAHPKVRDVAVIGVPDDIMGEAVRAVVIPAEGCTPGPALAEELIAHCRATIATYKCPRGIDFVDVLPRTETGKLHKRLVRERYWQGRESRLA